MKQEKNCQICQDTFEENNLRRLFGTIRVCSDCYLNALLRIKLKKMNSNVVELRNGMEVSLR